MDAVSTEATADDAVADGTAPRDPLDVVVTWLRRIGLGLLVLAVPAGLLGWMGAAGTSVTSEQWPYLVSGALLAIACAGLGATCVVAARVLRRVVDRRRRLEALHEATEELARRLRDEG